MSENTTIAPFAPTRPLRVPWADIGSWIAGSIGVLIAIAGALVLAHRGPWILADLDRSRGLDILAIAFVIGVGPVAFRSSAGRRRRLKLDERLPDFLTDLAALHKAGLTLPESLLTTAEGDYGPLTSEIRMAADQVRWNIPVLIALENLKQRLATPIAMRTLTVILEAGRTGGNLPEVMEVAARNSRTVLQLRQTRARQMGLYTIIIYVASLVFIGVTLSLQGIFVPKMAPAFGAGGASGLGLAGSLPTADEFRTLFYTSALVQAIGNGLVGGLMTGGRSLSGLRHAWILVIGTAIAFALV